MLGKGACASAIALFRNIGVDGQAAFARNATAVGAVSKPNVTDNASPDQIANVLRSLHGEQLRQLSHLAGSCKNRSQKHTDPVLKLAMRTFCDHTSTTTTTVSSTPYNVTASTATTMSSVTFGSPIPPQELAPTIQQLVVDGIHNHAQLSTIAESAISNLGELSTQAISDIALGFAQLGYFNIRFKSHVADEMVARMAEFSPAALANLAWAFGELQYFDCILMASILPHVKANVDQFSATDLAKVLWAYARVGYTDEALMDVMSTMAAKMGADFCPKTLSEVVFATAGLGWADPEVYQAIADHAQDNMAEYDGESLGKVLFGLASCGYDDADLFEAAAGRACEILGQMRPVDIARVMWALSQTGHYHTGFMTAVTERLPETMVLYDRDELKMLIGACNKLGCTTQSVAEAATLLQAREQALPEGQDEMPAVVGGPFPQMTHM